MDKDLLVCVPGQRLCLSNKLQICGQGTYERQGYIFSTLAGVVDIVEKDNVQVIEVHSCNAQTLVPEQGDIVTAKVITINQQFCKCVINCIGETVLSRTYRGILRKEDVRATEKDRVEIYKCFRPGDIILARVLPKTEAHTYQLSTAENELGVVIAHSDAGVAMVPVGWTEMQCPKTLAKAPRKVAKVVSETVEETDVKEEPAKDPNEKKNITT